MFPPFNLWALLLPSRALVFLDRLDDARWRLHDAVDDLRARRWRPAWWNLRALRRQPCMSCREAPTLAVLHLDTGDLGVCRDCLRSHVGVGGDRHAINPGHVRSFGDRAVPR